LKSATSFHYGTPSQIKELTMSDLMLDVDQAGELKAAFRRGNWTNAQIKKLCEGNALAEVRDVVLGLSEIKQVTYAIDCDADPFLPNDGWKVEEHRKDGVVIWDSAKVSLYFSKQQKGDKSLMGNDLRKELANQPVLNANVLDYLLKNTHLIPEDWKGKAVFFWGTIYRRSGGDLCVRCLCWGGGAWGWDYGWLGRGFNGRHPAVLRACPK
jgi:hypothetical protein